MFLLAESGSTKTDWREFNAEGVVAQFRTSGINPDLQSEAFIEKNLREDLVSNLYNQNPEGIFFYGAGLGGKHNVRLLQEILSRIFEGAKIDIQHDLLASARATCFGQPGISCILGTGSNSCYFDGEAIVREYGGHGYLFGDEGSGADLGKHLLKKFLDKDLGGPLLEEFIDWIGLPLLEVRTEVHRSPKPNIYLARVSRFIHQRLDRPEVIALVKERFHAFIDKTVVKYEGYQDLPVHFVGSIAWHYQDLLKEVTLERNLNPGKLLQAPVEELVRYHLEMQK